MIQDSKKEGKLVPSEIIVKLLQKAMQGSQNKKFLIDGFPRNEENLAAAENIVVLQTIHSSLFPNYQNLCLLDCVPYVWMMLQLKIEPDAVLFFDCSEEEMIRRLLNRNQVSICTFFHVYLFCYFFQIIN